MTDTPAGIRTETVGDGDALVHYDVRGDLAAGVPLFLFASPMDAVGFETLAGHFADRPVVTYDPRGSGRNPAATGPVTPQMHAQDLHHVIEALDVGPVDCLGSSGGGVNLLCLLQTHPDDVRRAVAHEPPTVALLPDREPALAALRDIVATYESSGEGAAMAKFIALVMHQGEVTEAYLRQDAPDPATFGMSRDDDGSRTSPLMRNMPSVNEYAPDIEALRAVGDRLSIAIGADSREAIAARGARSVADALGREAVVFPGGHVGFSGGEYGHRAEEPDAFAAKLRDLLG